MFYGINPTQTEAWKKLTAHFESTKNRTLKESVQAGSKPF